MTTYSCNKLISIIFPSTNAEKNITDTLASLSSSCSCRQDVEIIIKIDPGDNTGKYADALNRSGFSYKILQYDRLGKYNDVHLFNSDCAKIANGSIIWTLGDDVAISGDWHRFVSLSRNIFPDNIYVLYFKEHRLKKNKTTSKVGISFPLISREFYNRLGYISFNRHTERFCKEISYRINRQLCCNEVIVFNTRNKIHGQSNHTPPVKQPTSPQEWVNFLYPGSHCTIASDESSYSISSQCFNNICQSPETVLPNGIFRTRHR